LRSLVGVVAAALAAVVLVAPPSASASRYLQLGIFDDTQSLAGVDAVKRLDH